MVGVGARGLFWASAGRPPSLRVCLLWSNNPPLLGSRQNLGMSLNQRLGFEGHNS